MKVKAMNNIINAVEQHRNLILEAERYIWANPETGFKEVKTSKYMAEQFEKLGYNLTYADGITGFYTEIDTGIEGPTIMVLAELDSIICPAHKEADPETGAVHACGHNAQCAALLGVAGALKNESVLAGLCGKIRLCAVPAEEGIEADYRSSLRERGKIKYLGGKSEFLARGYFDGVDIAFMVHTSTGNSCSVKLGRDCGFISKRVIYKGVAAHAACSAYIGKNALYAATAGLNAVNALRETFKDDEKIRWHPIITHGGDMVNNIPDRVVIESQVRAANFNALEQENKKIDRALIGAALSFGSNIEIIDEPGYAPLYTSKELGLAAKEVFEKNFPEVSCVSYGGIGGGCTDMGDLSMLMPVMHPYIGGAIGHGHGDDYYITNPELACVISAKWQVLLLRLLLENDALRAKEVIENYKPFFNSREEFLRYKDSLRKRGDRIEYMGDGVVIKN